MKSIRSAAIATFISFAVFVAGCGPGPADLTTPIGSVTAAFEAAKSGGLLKQMDFFSCIYSGGLTTGAMSGAFAGLSKEAIAATGVDVDEFLGAFGSSFADFTATETSRTGDRAVVHLSVKVTLTADMGKLRDILKRYAAAQGLQLDDATIDAAINRQIGGPSQSQVMEHDVTVIERDGKWSVCDPTATAAGTPAVATPLGATPGPATPVIPTPTVAQPTPTPRQSSAPPIEGWQTFASASGGYSVLLPGPAVTAERSVPTPQGPAEIHEAGWQSPDQKTLYYTLAADYPPGLLSSQDQQVALNDFMSMITGQFQATMNSEADRVVGGLTAREFSMTTPTMSARGVVILNGDRVYLLLAGGGSASASDVDRFLDSFTVTSAPPSPPPLGAASSAP
jgi:hypothetical protein